MNQYACLRETCRHIAYRPVVMLGKIVQWRCRCGRIVRTPMMNNDVREYIATLQDLAVGRRKKGGMSHAKEALLCSTLVDCRSTMSDNDLEFADLVLSEFSCLHAKCAS